MTTQVLVDGIIFPDGTKQTTAYPGYGVPSGAILLWAGSIAAIPSGWVLCNGGNGTPNLLDRFVIGAGSSYAVNQAGGSTTITNANLPAHTHNYSGNTGGQSNDHAHGINTTVNISGGTTGGAGYHSHGVSDPGHAHSFNVARMGSPGTGGTNVDLRGGGGSNCNTNPGGGTNGSGTGIGIQAVGDHVHTWGGNANISGVTQGVNAGHYHGFSGTTDGGTGGGTGYLPPYYALCYIMKT